MAGSLHRDLETLRGCESVAFSLFWARARS